MLLLLLSRRCRSWMRWCWGWGLLLWWSRRWRRRGSWSWGWRLLFWRCGSRSWRLLFGRCRSRGLLLWWRWRWSLLLSWSRIGYRRQRYRRLCLLVLFQYLRQLIDVRLKELELLFARLSGSHDLHDRLQLWVCACSGCEHVNDRVGSRCRRWPRLCLRRCLLDRLGWWWSCLRLRLRWIWRLVVLLILWRMLTVLVVIRPCSILLRWGRHLLWHSSTALFRRV